MRLHEKWMPGLDSVWEETLTFLEGLRSDSKHWLSLQSKPLSLIRILIPLATSWALYQKYSRTSSCESRITSDIALDCCWTLLKAGIAANWQKTLGFLLSPLYMTYVCIYICLWTQSLFIHSANVNHSSVVGSPSPNYSPCFLEKWMAG